MKFKSNLAQEAYEEILKSGEKITTFGHPDVGWTTTASPASWEATARAIEVAAKIEIEMMRLENEETSSECVHGWASEERCPKCSLFLDEDPE